MTEQQKLIDEMKFQQGQAAFKEQIALLEQIKAKQVKNAFQGNCTIKKGISYVLFIFCLLKKISNRVRIEKAIHYDWYN